MKEVPFSRRELSATQRSATRSVSSGSPRGLTWAAGIFAALVACGEGATPSANGNGATSGNAGTSGASAASAGASALGGASGSAGTPTAGGGSGGSGVGGAGAPGGGVAGASGTLPSAGDAGTGGTSGAGAGSAGQAGSGAMGATAGVGGVGGLGGLGGGGVSGAEVGGGSGAGQGGAGQAGASGAGSSGLGGGGASGTAGYEPCPSSGPCKIMPFGDSITEGAGYSGGYRVELFRQAHQAGKNITFVGSQTNGPSMVNGVTFPVQHEGHGGWLIDTSGGRSGISSLVSSVMPMYAPHVITLMIGTNDATYDVDMANAPKRLGNLLDSIHALLPDVLVVLAQTIPTRDDSFNARLEPYNAAIPAVVQAHLDAGQHVRLVNMWPLFADTNNYKTTLLQDTWHPTSSGYAILGAAFYEALSDVL